MSLRVLEDVLEKSRRLVVGLMSGTSRDGIDAAVVEVEGSGTGALLRVVEFMTVPYEERLREDLDRLADTGSLPLAASLHFRLGRAFAEAALAVVERAGLRADDVDLIGSHGQTVYHSPPSRGTAPATVQLGDVDVIAKVTGITTVGDFRPSDMAAGGEGAPIVPYVDYVLFRRPGGVRVAQNVGGIANVTVVTEHLDEVVAFDTGPGNALMDGVVAAATGGERRYDRDGELARRGTVVEGLLSRLLSHPFLAKPPPKSTGLEEFGPRMARELWEYGRGRSGWIHDLLRTLLEFTVESIALAYERFVLPHCEPTEVVLSGGGALNPVLVDRLRARLAPLDVTTSDVYGVDPSAKEAVAMAFLASELLAGACCNLPSATGASRSVPMGKIALGGGC